MINKELLSVLDAILSRGTVLSNGEVKYFCPFCKHYKQKLQVNLDPNDESRFQRWHCWVCGRKGKTLVSLIKNEAICATNDQIERVQIISKRYATQQIGKEVVVRTEHILRLPQEYIPLYKKDDNIERRNALKYLKNRNVTNIDILRYDIGYAAEGEYKNMVIIPSYDTNGNLNYFVGRDYYDRRTLKHKNPDVSKNIIGFELLVDFMQPIVLVEGAFDAMATKRNAIPLFGKTISEKLFLKILEEKPPKIYISLDIDAIKSSISYAEKFMGIGIDVYIVELQKKDPSKLGYENMIIALNNAQLLNKFDLMKLKMKI